MTSRMSNLSHETCFLRNTSIQRTWSKAHWATCGKLDCRAENVNSCDDKSRC